MMNKSEILKGQDLNHRATTAPTKGLQFIIGTLIYSYIISWSVRPYPVSPNYPYKRGRQSWVQVERAYLWKKWKYSQQFWSNWKWPLYFCRNTDGGKPKPLLHNELDRLYIGKEPNDCVLEKTVPIYFGVKLQFPSYPREYRRPTKFKVYNIMKRDFNYPHKAWCVYEVAIEHHPCTKVECILSTNKKGTNLCARKTGVRSLEKLDRFLVRSKAFNTLQ